MITEDYVSFETAKLLREKGFDEYCLKSYFKMDKTLKKSGFSEWEKVNEIKAPTQSLAMKWLREVHNIMVSPYALSLGYYFEIFDLTNRDITGCKSLYKVGIPNKKDVLSTCEEACDAAIRYCLDNLI